MPPQQQKIPLNQLLFAKPQRLWANGTLVKLKGMQRKDAPGAGGQGGRGEFLNI